jgi:hypothetical protein
MGTGSVGSRACTHFFVSEAWAPINRFFSLSIPKSGRFRLRLFGQRNE